MSNDLTELLAQRIVEDLCIPLGIRSFKTSTSVDVITGQLTVAYLLVIPHDSADVDSINAQSYRILLHIGAEISVGYKAVADLSHPECFNLVRNAISQWKERMK